MSHFVIIDTIQSKKRSYSQSNALNYLSSTTFTKVLYDLPKNTSFIQNLKLSDRFKLILKEENCSKPQVLPDKRFKKTFPDDVD